MMPSIATPDHVRENRKKMDNTDVGPSIASQRLLHIPMAHSTEHNANMASAASSPTATFAVVFADVVGSTKLYEVLGDAIAKRLVDECVDLMRGVVQQYGGRVIKTIGDEVMSVLPTADSGCLAVMDMQNKIEALPELSGVKRAIRAGFHYGAVIEENNDVFGDTVNLAARMSGLAKAKQIITTRSTVEQMSPMLRTSTRRLAAIAVKGKADDVETYEVLWQVGDDLTAMATVTGEETATTNLAKLHLRYGAREMTLDTSASSIVVGRDETCQISVADRMASRHHARIERRRDKFYLVDQSTNGTFVAMDGEAEIILRREEMMLRGTGVIALGRTVGTNFDETVRFTVLA
jgi:adenylate cyclase